MPHAEPAPLFGVIFLIAFFSFWFYHAYLMLCRPEKWIDWFFRRPWKSFGIAVSIENQDKLRKRTRFLGMIYLVTGILFLVFFSVVIAVGK